MLSQDLATEIRKLAPREKIALALVISAVRRDDWVLACGLRTYAFQELVGGGGDDVEIDFHLLERIGTICDHEERRLWGALLKMACEHGGQEDVRQLEALMARRACN